MNFKDFISNTTVPRMSLDGLSSHLKTDSYLENLLEENEEQITRGRRSFDKRFAEFVAWLDTHFDQYPEAKSNNLIEKSLAIWVRRIRECYHKMMYNPNISEALSEEQIKKLNDIHFVWSVRKDLFSNRFKQFSNWLKTHNNKYPTDTGGPEELLLANWVRRLRISYKKGSLSADKIERLNSIGFIWEALVDTFPIRLYEFIEWLKTHNNKYPYKLSKNNFESKLGYWVAHMRTLYRRGTLQKDRIEKLNSIGFIWEVIDNSFLIHFNEFVEWLKTHNNKYPSEYGPQSDLEKTLAIWIVVIRRSRRKGTLPQDKIDMLDSIEFAWRPLEERFMKNYNDLKVWLKTHNYVHPTGDPASKTDPLEKRLLNWMIHLRRKFKAGKLSEDQVRKLNFIRFDWDRAETRLRDRLDSFEEYYHFA